MNELANEFTSDGSKFFLHQEAMRGLRDGRGMPIVSHIMLTDRCQHTCAFCSVATREGGQLTMQQIKTYLRQLVPLGLKSVILSGGGNPILYRDRESGADFNDAVSLIKHYGLEIGVITNGLKMADYPAPGAASRKSWVTVSPETLDKLTWVRISMSGLDHDEREVFVPDIDPARTTLGFSYVYHDKYTEPLEKNHGKVSTLADLRTPLAEGDGRQELGRDRLPWLRDQIASYVARHRPVYVRLLPNCLEPERIKGRCTELQAVADSIDPGVVFVQYKPPAAPNKCFLGYVHPVLNSDGYVYPCDSCVLNATAGHKFARPWRICRWDEVAAFYTRPVTSIVDPKKLCPGCVFTSANLLLEKVVAGLETPLPATVFAHPNFV